MATQNIILNNGDVGTKNRISAPTHPRILNWVPN